MHVSPVECEESQGLDRSPCTMRKTKGTKPLVVDDEGARFIEPALRGRHMLKSWGKTRKTFNPHRVQSLWWSTTMISLRMEAAPSILLSCTLKSLENGVAIGNTTLVRKSTRMWTSHYMTFWEKVSWIHWLQYQRRQAGTKEKKGNSRNSNARHRQRWCVRWEYVRQVDLSSVS